MQVWHFRQSLELPAQY